MWKTLARMAGWVTIREPVLQKETIFHTWTGLPLSKELEASFYYQNSKTTEIFSNGRSRPFTWPVSFTLDTAVHETNDQCQILQIPALKASSETYSKGNKAG